jgi:hypothetical protein
MHEYGAECVPWKPAPCPVDVGFAHADYWEHEATMKIELPGAVFVQTAPSPYLLNGEAYVCGRCGLLFWKPKEP